MYKNTSRESLTVSEPFSSSLDIQYVFLVNFWKETNFFSTDTMSSIGIHVCRLVDLCKTHIWLVFTSILYDKMSTLMYDWKCVGYLKQAQKMSDYFETKLLRKVCPITHVKRLWILQKNGLYVPRNDVVKNEPQSYDLCRNNIK